MRVSQITPGVSFKATVKFEDKGLLDTYVKDQLVTAPPARVGRTLERVYQFSSDLKRMIEKDGAFPKKDEITIRATENPDAPILQDRFGLVLTYQPKQGKAELTPWLSEDQNEQTGKPWFYLPLDKLSWPEADLKGQLELAAEFCKHVKNAVADQIAKAENTYYERVIPQLLHSLRTLDNTHDKLPH